MFIGEAVRNINTKIGALGSPPDLASSYLNKRPELSTISKIESPDKLTKVSDIILSGLQSDFLSSVVTAVASYQQDSRVLFSMALLLFLLTIPIRFLPLVKQLLDKIRIAKRVANVLPFEMVLADAELLKKVEALAI